MIHCYVDDLTGRYALAYCTLPDGTILGLYDMLTNKAAYTEVCKLLHPIKLAIASSFKLGDMFTDLFMDSLPENAVVETLASPSSETFATEIVKVLDNSANIKFHDGFKHVGDMDDAAKEYFRAHVTKPPTLREGIMNSPEDPLAFSVPTYEELYSVYSEESLKNGDNDDDAGENGDESSGDLPPAMTNFFGEAQSTLDGIRDFQSLNPTIDLKHIKVDLAFRYYNSVCYREILADKNCPYHVPLSYVEGNQELNFLEIQDNEREYYDALVRLMREGLSREYNATTDEEIDKLISQGFTSTIVEAYLSDLANLAFQLNWSHTGSVITPTSSDNQGEEEGEDSVSSAVPGYYTVQYDPSTKQAKIVKKPELLNERISEFTFVDGFNRVKRYINFNTLNSYRWIEALIRLLRWGSRKPSCLCVKNQSKDRQEYLDLNALEPTNFAGSLDELIPVVNPETGNQLAIYGSVWMGYTQQSIADIDTVNNVFRTNLTASPKYPLAVALVTNFEGQSLFRLEFVDIFTFITLVSKGALKVDGVTFDEGTNTFKVSAEAKANFIRQAMSIDMALHCNIPDAHVVISPSSKLVHTLQAMHGRLQNIKPVDINIFRVINGFYNLDKFDKALDTEQAFMIANATEREEALSEKRKFYADDFDNQVVKAVMREVVSSFMKYADVLADYEGDPQGLALDELLDKAWDTQVNMDVRTSPVRSTTPRLPINPVFTTGIRKLNAVSKIEAVIPGNSEPTIVGYLGQFRPEGGSMITYIWAPDEYEYNRTIERTLPLSDFWNRLYTQYLDLEKRGVYERYHNKTLVPATTETWTTIGRNAFLVLQEIKGKTGGTS